MFLLSKLREAIASLPEVVEYLDWEYSGVLKVSESEASDLPPPSFKSARRKENVTSGMESLPVRIRLDLPGSGVLDEFAQGIAPQRQRFQPQRLREQTPQT